MRIRDAIVLALAMLAAGSVLAQDLPVAQGAAGLDDIRDNIDSRAPENRQVSKLIKQIDERIRLGEWAIAVAQLQSILNQPGDRLVRLGPGRFVSMRSAANTLLGKMPRQWKQRYAAQFNAVAQKSLDKALAAGDYSAVGDVATRYFQTPAGSDAARAIAVRHFDRSEFGMALRWLELLANKHGKLDSTVDQLQRAAIQKLADVEISPVQEPIELGGNTFSANELLKDVVRQNATAERTDWPMLMGSADRMGLVTNRLPLLLAAWKQPLVEGEATTDRIRRATESVLESHDGLPLTAIPLVVNGVVACRTMDGVAVFDIATGRLKWRTNREASTTKVLQRNISRYPRIRSDDNVTDYLFRDAVHGLISSDGQRLFVIEQQSLPTQSSVTSRRTLQWQLTENGTNVLAAYDLATGALLWAVGGADSPEVFKPALAGHYFHGVPVAVGEELFVVSEKENAIRLQALDAGSGQVKWSQLLAFSDTKIERDFYRRHTVAQVTFTEGMLLCPTTADWLIAINPLTRGILWARRHKAPSRTSSTGIRRITRSLSESWAASAPVATRNRVIFTPAESPYIEALDLTTGEQVWRRSKGNFRYLAGLLHGNAIVVASNRVVALQIKDGNAAWTLDLPEGDRPAGRGVLSPDFLHQPLTSGQVVSVDLQTGTIAHRTGTLRPQEMTGNMVMHAAGTVLQTSTSLEAYGLRPEAEMVPNASPESALRSAEIAFADGKTDEAIAILDTVESKNFDPLTIARYKNLLISALTSRVRSGSKTGAVDLERLATLTTNQELLTQLRIVQETTSGNLAGAFRQLVALYGTEANPRIQLDHFVVDRDQWLAGRLLDTWNQMDDNAREEIAEDVANLANDDQSDRFQHVFAFHPASLASLDKRLTTHLSENRFCEAEQVIRSIKRMDPENTDVVLRGAIALAKAGQRVDAIALLQEHGTADQIDQLPAAAPNDNAWDWNTATWEQQQYTGSGPTQFAASLPVMRRDIQFYRDHMCLAHTGQSRRLQFQSLPKEMIAWSLPLRSDSVVRALTPLGRSLLVRHSTTLSCVSPLDRRVLWERSLQNGSTTQPRVFFPLTAPDISDGQPLPAIGFRQVSIANEEYVCIRDARSIQVIDAVTGQFRWSRNNIANAADIFGTTEGVFVKHQDGRQTAFRAQDGHPLPDAAITNFSQTYAAIGRHVFAIENKGILFKRATLRLYDPITGDDVWSLKLERGARVAVPNEREAIVSTRSQIQLVNLITGATTDIDTDLKLNQSPMVALAHDKLFVAANQKAPTATNLRINRLAVHGQFAVFNLPDGKQLWKRQIENGTLALSGFTSLPVLLMSENVEAVDLGPRKATVQDLIVLDIGSGRKVAEQKLWNLTDSGYRIRFEPLHRFVEIAVSTSRRYRFLAKPADKPSQESEAPLPQSNDDNQPAKPTG